MNPMGRIGPTEIIIIAVLIIVIFGWKRLPDAARSLGRSARVFKSEVDEMKKENEASKSEASTTTVRSEPIEPARRVDTPVVDTTVRATDGNAVHENAPRTDNQSGPVA
jgi:sec-independent protein translocase protein TatA